MLCVKKYGELWGKEWVDERIGTIGDEWKTPIENNTLYYGIAQSDSLRNPPKEIVMGTTPAQHHTSFKVNLVTGEVEVLSHE